MEIYCRTVYSKEMVKYIYDQQVTFIFLRSLFFSGLEEDGFCSSFFLFFTGDSSIHWLIKKCEKKGNVPPC
jgi:hypothetical protein